MSQVIPEGWARTTVGSYLHLKNGFAFKSGWYIEEGETTVPVIRISDINGKYASTTKAAHVSSNNAAEGFEIQNGDLLIAMSGATTGKVGVYTSHKLAYQNQRVGNLRLNSEINGCASYRNYLISNLTPDILKIAYGGAQPNISGKAIEGMDINLPPLAEQKVIADKLDELLVQVESTKARLDAIPAILKSFRQSVLAAAVSGKLTEEWRGGDNTSQLVSIDNVCHNAFDGPFGSKLKTADYTDSGVRVARLENVGHLNFIEEKQTFISENKYKELTRNTLEENDILFSSFVEEEVRVCLFPKHHSTFINKADCFCLRVNDDIALPKFVVYVLASRSSYEQIKSNVQGVTRPRINLKILKSLTFHFPNLKEQTEIVGRVEELFAFADKVEAQVHAAQARVNNLTQSILAKAFRGELTAEWRAANPELITGENSAEALLERIKAEREALALAAKAAKKKPRAKKAKA